MNHELKIPLMNIFSQSLPTEKFPDKMKSVRVSPIFKNVKKSIAPNYRPTSALLSFSKILERIMYNRLYSYLIENDISFNKQFGFREGHLTKHALLELFDQISNTFNNKKLFTWYFHWLIKSF